MTQHLKILQDMEDALDDAYAAGVRNAKREWVGLTPEERKQLWNEWENGHVVEATEAKLKQKNGYAEEKNT